MGLGVGLVLWLVSDWTMLASRQVHSLDRVNRLA